MSRIDLAYKRHRRAEAKAQRIALKTLHKRLPEGTISSRGVKAPSTSLLTYLKRSAKPTLYTSDERSLKVALPTNQFGRHFSRDDLINAESKIGSTIFGPIPEGHRREFFHDKNNIWIWHEDWLDHEENLHQITVRYEVRPSGIYKKVSAGRYIQLVGAELENFCQATHVYLYLIKHKLMLM